MLIHGHEGGVQDRDDRRAPERQDARGAVPRGRRRAQGRRSTIPLFAHGSTRAGQGTRAVDDLVKSIPVLSNLLLVGAEQDDLSRCAARFCRTASWPEPCVALVSAFLGVCVILKRIVFVSAAISQISSLGVACAFLVAGLFGHHASEVKSRFLSGPGATSIVFACLAAIFLARQVSEKRITRESILGIGYLLPAGLTLLILDALSAEAHAIEDILFGNSVFVSVEQLPGAGGDGRRGAADPFRPLQGVRVHVARSRDGHRFRSAHAAVQPDLAPDHRVHDCRVDHVHRGPAGLRLHGHPGLGGLTLTERLGKAFLLSVVFGVSSALVGFYLSFVFSLPTGPAMLTTAGLFLIPGGARTLVVRWRPGGGGA